MLVDRFGNPLVGEQQKKKAEDQLKEYVQKYHSRFADWFRANGPMSRPPVLYDVQKQEWFWVD